MYAFKSGYYADIRIEDRYNTEIRFKNGNLEEAKETDVKKAFIRVFDGKMWYYSSTGAISKLQEELDTLYAYAEADEKIEENEIVAKFQVNKASKIVFADKCVKNIPFSEKRKAVTDTLDRLSSEYCVMKVGIYLDRYSLYEFYSSKGAELKYDFQTSGAAYSLSFANGNEKFSNMLSKCVTDFADIAFDKIQTDEFISDCEDFLLNAVSVEPGSFPVILSPEVTGVFAHESFGHKSESDFMLGDETMAKEWTIGKKVGSDILTIRETGVLLGSGYVPYDDEGTKATDTYLIKNGVLAGRLHSATTAAAMGEALTGNARAISCDYEPIVRMTSTFIESGSSSLDSLIAGIDFGYFIKNCKHGSGMSTFTIAPNLAYEIKDGKISRPVKIAVMTGNVFETLGLIDGVSDKKELLSFVTGGCGKMEQYPLNVGMGGPYIRISKMNIQ